MHPCLRCFCISACRNCADSNGVCYWWTLGSKPDLRFETQLEVYHTVAHVARRTCGEAQESMGWGHHWVSWHSTAVHFWRWWVVDGSLMGGRWEVPGGEEIPGGGIQELTPADSCRLHLLHSTCFVPAVSGKEHLQAATSSGPRHDLPDSIHEEGRHVSQLAFLVVNGFWICHALKSSTCTGVGEDHEYRALLRAIASMYREYTACSCDEAAAAESLVPFLHATLVFMMSFFTPLQYTVTLPTLSIFYHAAVDSRQRLRPCWKAKRKALRSSKIWKIRWHFAWIIFCVPFSTRPRPKWSERPMRYLGHAELLRIFFAPRRTIWSKWMQSMTPIQTSYRIFIQLFRTESRCTDFQLPFDLHNLHSLHSTIGFQWFVPSPRAKDPGHVCDSRHSWRILPKVAAGEGLVDVAFQENAQYEEFIPRHWPIWHNLAHCNGVQNIGMILCPCNPILGILYNPTVCIHNYTHTHIHITSYYIILIHITHYAWLYTYNILQSPTYFHLAFCPSSDARYQDWWSMGWRHHRAIGILIGSPYNMYKGKEERGSDVFQMFFLTFYTTMKTVNIY